MNAYFAGAAKLGAALGTRRRPAALAGSRERGGRGAAAQPRRD